MTNLWQTYNGPRHIKPIQGQLHRLVESQEQVATTALVDDLAEQALLEDMLETSKPPAPGNAEDLHYLLSTPFRYPPLPHGSRFGRRIEPSLFYGSVETTTTLAESAYYRLIFLTGMLMPPPSQRILSQHSLFTVGYRTDHGIQLQCEPWIEHADQLRHPSEYQATQALGSKMRSAGVKGFEFTSARDPDEGTNVALYEPECLTDQSPRSIQPVICDTQAQAVSFSIGTQAWRFPLELFLVDGELPRPAN